MAIPAKYQSGDIYNQLLLTGKSFMEGKVRKVEYICFCGIIGWTGLDSIKSNSTKSCGCWRSNRMTVSNTTHGLTKHPLYKTWINIKDRCTNVKNKRYSFYGGLGVKICEEWKDDFEAFYNWAIKSGWVEGLQIDKDIIPKKIGVPATIYSPEMCCIVSCIENNRNRSVSIEIEYQGMKKPLIVWCQELGLNYCKTHYRIRKGWDVKKAFNN